MRKSIRGLLPGIAAMLAAMVLGACASNRPEVARGPFIETAPFSKTIEGSGDVVCWCVKRALLSQGYMLDRSSEPGVLTGTRDYQPDDKLNVTLHLQTTCADNRNGTSIVFVTAMREESKLQKMKQSSSVGIGPATLTMPSGSAKVLGTVRRETIQEPDFYNSFFTLVEGYVVQETRSHPERHAELHNPEPLTAEPGAQAPGQSNSNSNAPPPASLPPASAPPQDSQGR